MNNRIKCDTTMLQSNTAMHLMAFMLTQRDLLLQLIEVIESYENIIKSSVGTVNVNDMDNAYYRVLASLVEDINKLNEPPLRKQIREVGEDFEYIIKLHTHAIHQRNGTRIYKKDPENGQWVAGKTHSQE